MKTLFVIVFDRIDRHMLRMYINHPYIDASFSFLNTNIHSKTENN